MSKSKPTQLCFVKMSVSKNSKNSIETVDGESNYRERVNMEEILGGSMKPSVSNAQEFAQLLDGGCDDSNTAERMYKDSFYLYSKLGHDDYGNLYRETAAIEEKGVGLDLNILDKNGFPQIEIINNCAGGQPEATDLSNEPEENSTIDNLLMKTREFFMQLSKVNFCMIGKIMVPCGRR